MVHIDKVVTRGGDGGKTSLGDNTRVAKDDVRVAAYGTVDEANATIGVLRLYTKDDTDVDAALIRVQHDLFDLGADLCVPGIAGDRLRVTDVPCERLELEIAAITARLKPLDSFVLPGGTTASAHAHLARTVIRRAERHVTTLMQTTEINMSALRYLNRLSDYLFVLARRMNDYGHSDIEWVPGKNLQPNTEQNGNSSEFHDA
jgi:cob(I)alamin adenosyltransferase